MKKSNMELDLDSFLVSDSDSDSDLDSSSVPHRTVDEILNASSSSSASSSPPSSPPSINRRKQDDPNRRLSEALTNVTVVRPESGIHRGFPPTRRNSTSTSSSSLRQLPLPSLFAGVRSNVKPGAALAAAVAASRLVPTPHAAIIKSRRASSASSDLLQQVSNQEEDDQEVNSSNGDSIGVVAGSVSMDDFHSFGGESRMEDEDSGVVVVASQGNEAKVMEVQANDITETLNNEVNSKPDLVTAFSGFDAKGDVSAEQEATTTAEAESAVHDVKDDTILIASLVESSESQHLNDSDGKCYDSKSLSKRGLLSWKKNG